MAIKKTTATDTLRAIRERTTQAPVGAPGWGNEGESVPSQSLFSFPGSDLSRDLEGGFKKEEEKRSSQVVPTRRFDDDAEYLMDMEPDAQVSGLKVPTNTESLGCFGALTSSASAAPPVAAPLKIDDASGIDSKTMKTLDSFIGKVSALAQPLTALKRAATAFDKQDGGQYSSLSATSFTSPLASVRLTSAATAVTDPGVHLVHYQGGDSLCLGKVASNSRVCSVHSSLCAYQSHRIKVVLQPGWYIAAATKNSSFFRLPFVSEDDGQASPTFLSLCGDPLPHARWTVIFNETSNGTLGDNDEAARFLMEERSGPVDQTAPAQTPFKRPKFGRNKFPSESEEEVNEKRWAMAEESFQTAGVRLLNVEGEVGKSPTVRPSSTLWEGIQTLDTSVSTMATYLRGDLATELGNITTLAQSASSMASSAVKGVTTLNTRVGQNSTATLNQHITTLEGRIDHLHDLITESSSLMLDIINGKIPIRGQAAGSGKLDLTTAAPLTQAAFRTYQEEQKKELAMLKQEIGGGGYTIGSDLFTTLEESVSYCHKHFPPGSYDCIVGLMALMGSVTDSVVNQSEVDDRMLLGARTNRSPQQGKIIASFSANYPAILAGPKAGRSSAHDFGALKTPKDWDYGDCKKGLAFTLTASMRWKCPP